ncbi:MAG: gamma-glutamyl-gamma-aminobutyrate hydrolase family protein, partial [Bacteroidota bacterium]
QCYYQAQENGIAVLGICRGLQFINCLLGGTLIQDLGSLNQTHKGNPDKIHPVKVEPGTRLEDIVDVREGSVNSSHHQAIDKLGKGLTVNCHAPDGTIEGIERTDRHAPFLLAVQWHPEDIPDLDSPFAKNILLHFIQASSR